MIAIRPWKFSDASFVISVRNRPELRKWFRQDHDLSLKEQQKFMKVTPEYHGYIIIDNRKRVGVVALHGEELCVAAPLIYHTSAVRYLEKFEKPKRMYGEVFAQNPALMSYLWCGFKVLWAHAGLIHIEKICAS